MGAIFLSYAREDRTCAEALAGVLEAAGHDVWWDRRLGGGEEFTAEIEAALDKAEIVLVAWSKASVKSRWVRDEASVGGDTGRLIPVSIDGSRPPMGFRQFHSLDLTGWRAGRRDSRTTDLLLSVERRLEGKGGRPPTAGLAQPKPLTPHLLGKPIWIAAAVLMLVIAASALLFVKRGNDSDAPRKPAIALLPFITASPDPELRELATQARDSIAHSFSQSGLPVRLLDAVPRAGERPDFTIAGDLSRNSDKLIATVHFDEVGHGVTVYSHRFEATAGEARDLPDRIGAQMAATLAWGSPLLILDRRRPLAPALLSDLLQSADFTADPLQSYQTMKRLAAQAPNVQGGQLGLAFYTAFVLDQLPPAERGQAVADARRAADRALQLAPRFGDTYATWCELHSETRIAECEDRLRTGRRIDPDAPFLNTFLSHLLRNVGRFEESMDLARLAHAHDVYVPTKIAWMLKSLEYSGESDEARDLYQQGGRWWPEYKPMFFRNRLFGLMDRGDFEGMQRLEKEIGPVGLPPNYVSSGIFATALKAKSLTGARRACPNSDDLMLNLRCMLALASLGDQSGAYAIADKLYPRRVGRTPSETERIWLDEPDGAGPLEFVTSPAAAPLRRDPRYLRLAERTGLLAYWRSGRAPDFCRANPEPVCRELLTHGTISRNA